MRNFDSEHRVPACPRCGKSNIIELPKETETKEKNFSEAFEKFKTATKLKAFTFAKAVQSSLYKAKIALLWATTPVPKVEA
jgi:hypothetical protein